MLALLACGLLVISEFYLRLSGAVMVGLPSTALGMAALMLLVVRRPTWPWLLAAAVVMALALQTKLLAAITLPAPAAAIYVNTPNNEVQGLRANWQQRLGRVIVWAAMTGAAYLLLGLALGALHFDLLFGTHLGAMTGVELCRGSERLLPALRRAAHRPTCCWVRVGLPMPRIAAQPACSYR